MTFPVIQSVTGTGFATNTTGHACALPATVTADDLLILLFYSLHEVATTTTPTGWTEELSVQFGASPDNACRVYTLKAAGTEGGGTVDVVTDPGNHAAAQIYRITSWSETLTDVEAGSATGSGTAPNPPDLTPSGGGKDHMWLACDYSIDDDVTLDTYPTNYTDGAQQKSGGGGNDGPAVGSARRELNATAEDPGVFALASSEAWAGVTIVIPPAAASAASQFPEYDRAGRQFLFSSPLLRM